MNKKLKKQDQAKIYLAFLNVLEPDEDLGIGEAFADVISFGGDYTLSEVFTFSESLSALVTTKAGASGQYLRISEYELSKVVDNRELAIAALRLNGFKLYKDTGDWTNSPTGGCGQRLEIAGDFFAEYLRDWASYV